MHVLPFERPIAELAEHVRSLRQGGDEAALKEALASFQEKAQALFAELSPIQKVQLSRHPDRPYTLDYAKRLLEDFVELRGDRRFAEDASIAAGIGKFRGRSVMLIGHQKGRGTKENMKRNFGMPHPEGYRKAIRLFEMADRFGLPIVTLIDTPGAYPGIGAEERGQSEAIGAALAALSRVRVPVIAIVIGEGGSGGALALGLANRVLVLEAGCYSVISPEGCAAILWKDGARAEEAALRLKLTAPELLSLKIVDEVIDEPIGGAHHDHDDAAARVGEAIERHLSELEKLSGDELKDDRYRRFRALGSFEGPAFEAATAR